MPKRGRPPGVKKNWIWATKQCPEPKEITIQQLKTVYGVAEKRCVSGSSCRKNCKDNPNCFLHLGGERWKVEDTSPSVADEVVKERCRDGDTPVGLANLGATCYANSLMQIWFHDMAFRKAIYAYGLAETGKDGLTGPLPEVPAAKRLCVRSDESLQATANPPAVAMATDGSDQNACGSNDRVQPVAVEDADTSFQEFRSDNIVDHLAYLFTRLQNSRHKWLTATHLVDFLGLEYQEQQDVQEFRKLFLNMLEQVLRQDAPSGGPGNLLSQQYTGTYSYITLCKGCKSTTQVDSSFQELELSIENKSTLEECLHEFFKEELLTGDNQYFCSHCNSKQDATRRIQLRSTPPVLTLLLLRFVFNMEIMAKMKVPTYVAFPEVLDLSAFTGCHDDVYHLSSTIIHTGPTAYSGHYIAHIKVPQDGKWWRFDDQSVKVLEGRKSHVGQEKEVDMFGEQPPKRPKPVKGYFTSSNAYILVYMRGCDRDTTPHPSTVVPPDSMQRKVEGENAILQAEVEKMMRESRIVQEDEERQRKELSQVYSSLPVKPGSKSFHWLSTAWVAKLLSGQPPGPIDNTSFLCKHSRLLPDAASKVKRVNSSTASYLYKCFGLESVELTNEMMCAQCVLEQCSLIQGQLEVQRDQTLLTSLLKTSCTSSSGFWVGKGSLQSWRKLLNAAILSGQEEVKDEVDREEAGEGANLKGTDEENAVNLCCKKESVVSLLTDSEGEGCRQEACQQEACQQEACKQEACQEACQQESCQEVCQETCQQDACQKEACQKEACQKEVCQQEACQQEVYQKEACQKEVGHLEDHQKVEEGAEDGFGGPNERGVGDNEVLFSSDVDKARKPVADSNKAAQEDAGSFNEDVLCVHGQLTMNETQRKLVSADAWSLLKKYFPSAPTCEALAHPCPLCASVAACEVEEVVRLKEKAENERAVLPDLYSLKSRPRLSEEDGVAYVVPKTFVQQWIQFVRHGGVKGVPELDMGSLLCCHKGLLLDLRRGEAALHTSAVLLWEHEWDTLKSSYFTCEEVRLWKSTEAGEGKEEGRTTALLSDPAVCWTCVEAQKKQDAMVFDKGHIYVHATEGDPLAVEESRPAHSGWSLRRRLPPGCTKVEVSALQTLSDLKMQLMHIYGSSPSDIAVYCNGEELTGGELALVKLGIVPNSLLVVKMTSMEESRNRFIRETAANEKEGGFIGTNLITRP